MKLYTYQGAPNPRRVHMYLLEKGLDVPCERVDIMKRENRTPEFMRDKNAMGGIPVLELDDGTHIAESVAICRYFEALHPEPSLFGQTAAEQGTIEMWIRRMELNFMVPVGMVWVHGSPLTARVMKQQIPEVAGQNRKLVEQYFGFLDDRLGDCEFIAGDAFSMADILALCTLDFGRDLNGLDFRPDQKNLARWYSAISARPSAQASLGQTPSN